jgi:hypothetical protein
VVGLRVIEIAPGIGPAPGRLGPYLTLVSSIVPMSLNRSVTVK